MGCITFLDAVQPEFSLRRATFDGRDGHNPLVAATRGQRPGVRDSGPWLLSARSSPAQAAATHAQLLALEQELSAPLGQSHHGQGPRVTTHHAAQLLPFWTRHLSDPICSLEVRGAGDFGVGVQEKVLLGDFSCAGVYGDEREAHLQDPAVHDGAH